MAKKFEGKRGLEIQDLGSSEAEVNSSQARERSAAGSDNRGIYTNKRGELCYGSECISIAINQEQNQIKVNLKPTDICKLDPLVMELFKAISKGGKTVYEVGPEDNE